MGSKSIMYKSLAACYLTSLGSPTSSKQALSSSPEPVVSCRYKSSRVALGARVVWGIRNPGCKVRCRAPSSEFIFNLHALDAHQRH